MTVRTNVIAVVPAFNVDFAELESTIASLLNQTYSTDICIVDDGSAVPIRYEHLKVFVLRQVKNGGITEALKAGTNYAMQAGYEYLVRLDVGDVTYPERVEMQIELMRERADVGLVGAWSRIVDLAGNELAVHGATVENLSNVMWQNAPFKHSTFCIRLSSVREHGGYDEHFCGAEDYELTLRLARRSAISIVEKILIDYEDNPGGISNTKRAKQLRARLRAQLHNKELRSLAFYKGIVRTLITMSLPASLAKRVSIAAMKQ